jgi:hypothetical protein
MMTIFREIKKHPLNYLILFLLFLFVGILLIVFRFDSHNQRRIVYLTAGLYLGWSLYHHYRRGDLSLSIFIEYLLLALFALIVVAATL